MVENLRPSPADAVAADHRQRGKMLNGTRSSLRKALATRKTREAALTGSGHAPKEVKRSSLPISIDTYVPSLLGRLALKMIKAATSSLDELDLTILAWRVLLALAEYRTLNVGELARLTTIEMPTLSRTLRQMQTARLVSRRRAREDTRSVRITLTEKGQSVFVETIPRSLAVEKRLLRGLKAREVEILRAALLRLHENLDAPEHGMELQRLRAARPTR